MAFDGVLLKAVEKSLSITALIPYWSRETRFTKQLRSLLPHSERPSHALSGSTRRLMT